MLLIMTINKPYMVQYVTVISWLIGQGTWLDRYVTNFLTRMNNQCYNTYILTINCWSQDRNFLIPSILKDFFVFQPVYLPQAGKSDARILSIKGCGSSSYCDFSTFKDLTKDYLLPEREYYSICNIKTEL